MAAFFLCPTLKSRLAKLFPGSRHERMSGADQGRMNMTELTRRQVLDHVLAGAAATALAPLSPALAAAPISGKQAAGIYRYKVGSIECTSINDGARSFPMP